MVTAKVQCSSKLLRNSTHFTRCVSKKHVVAVMQITNVVKITGKHFQCLINLLLYVNSTQQKKNIIFQLALFIHIYTHIHSWYSKLYQSNIVFSIFLFLNFPPYCGRKRQEEWDMYGSEIAEWKMLIIPLLQVHCSDWVRSRECKFFLRENFSTV